MECWVGSLCVYYVLCLAQSNNKARLNFLKILPLLAMNSFIDILEGAKLPPNNYAMLLVGLIMAGCFSYFPYIFLKRFYEKNETVKTLFE